jgi:hypothetical protein
MTKLICIVAFVLLSATLLAGQSERASNAVSPYPNELPNLQLFKQAKWKAIQPFVSTQADVDRILGQPVSVYQKSLGEYVNGYEDDPDWTIVVTYLGKGGDVPATAEGRVSHITLYPKKRVPLTRADFSSVFKRYGSRANREGEITVYYDQFGLRYSVYEADSADGSIHAGDLHVIIYGPSEVDIQKQKNSAQVRP